MNPEHCPYCRSKDIYAVGNIGYAEEGKVVVMFQCDDCKRVWMDTLATTEERY